MGGDSDGKEAWQARQGNVDVERHEGEGEDIRT